MNNSLKPIFPASPTTEEAKLYFDKIKVYEEMMMRYQCAILEIETKLKVLSSDMSVRYNRNPIEFIKSRIKKPESIASKLERKGFDVSIKNMIQQINDVAGIRVICSFIDDIYEIAAMLSRQNDVTVLEVKDYIKNPKASGYRSYHMIVEIPIFFSDTTMNMRVEIQIRTIAMNFWASLEHELTYKNDINDAEKLRRKLYKCAETINKTDLEMQNIRDEIYHHK